MGDTDPRDLESSLPPGPRVLMYHSVSPEPAPDPHRLRIHPDLLDRQLDHLRRRGLRGVPLAEWVRAHHAGRATGLVALTFDDGYRDFVEHAMPILARHGMTATVYIVTGKLGGTSDWIAGGPVAPLMCPDDVRSAAASGHEIGSHTQTHPRLAQTSPEDIRREVADSRTMLEDLLQAPVDGLAYPYGSFDERAVEAARAAGYRYACVTGDHRRPRDHTIPRLFVGPSDSPLRLELKFLLHRYRGWRCAPSPSAH